MPITDYRASDTPTEAERKYSDPWNKVAEKQSQTLTLTEKLTAAQATIAELRTRAEAFRAYIDANTTFYNVDADWPVDSPNMPVLGQVSNRIWYHATDDETSYPFSAVIDAALASQPERKHVERSKYARRTSMTGIHEKRLATSDRRKAGGAT